MAYYEIVNNSKNKMICCNQVGFSISESLIPPVYQKAQSPQQHPEAQIEILSMKFPDAKFYM